MKLSTLIPALFAALLLANSSLIYAEEASSGTEPFNHMLPPQNRPEPTISLEGTGSAQVINTNLTLEKKQSTTENLSFVIPKNLIEKACTSSSNSYKTLKLQSSKPLEITTFNRNGWSGVSFDKEKMELIIRPDGCKHPGGDLRFKGKVK